MSRNRISQINASFDSDVTAVWNVVTNNQDYAWHSDISRIEILDDNTFIEFNKNGSATEFTITRKEKNKAYAFEIKNKMFKGSWSGQFHKLEAGGTNITFTEDIYINNIFIWLFSLIFWDLQKIQQKYVRDLKTKLGK